MINFTCIKCGGPNNNVKVFDGAKTVACEYCNAANDAIFEQQSTAPAVTPQITTVHKSNCWAVDDPHVVIRGPYCQGCGAKVNPGTTRAVTPNIVSVAPIAQSVRKSPVNSALPPHQMDWFQGCAAVIAWFVGSLVLGFVLYLATIYLGDG